MTLRTRLLVGLGAVLAVVVAVGVLVVVVQRNELVHQIDAQLEAIAPLPRQTGPPGGLLAGDLGSRPAPFDESISDIYVAALLDDGSVATIVKGQLLDTTPDIAGMDLVSVMERTLLDVDAAEGSTTFRALLIPAGDATPAILIALPLDGVDEAVRSLIVTFVVASALVAVTLALTGWWVVRLGLHPIAAMTDTAKAIASGSRDERVATAAPGTEAGQLGAALNTMLDQRDDAEDRLRRFVSDASHELRTPLTSIQGYLDLYADGGFRGPGELEDAVRRMRSEANRMSALVADLLQLARLDEGGALVYDVIDVDELLADAVRDTAAAHPDRSIVITSTAGDAPALSGDPQRLHQLIAGLIENAIVHAPQATVTVESRRLREQIEIIVGDDGPGMDPDEAAQAFDRFFRGDRSRSRVSGGSGLGLAISRSIVEAHGGKITLVTAPGDGCRFTITFPA